MPTVDERLEQLFAEAAVEPTPNADVLGAVAHKRRQRHTRRMTRNVVALVAGSLVVAGAFAWLTTDDGTEPAVAPSHVDGPVAARPTGTDAWSGASELVLDPDRGYVRGPLLASGEYAALATYDRDGSGFKVPPARVVRIDASGRVVDEVELQGEILSLAEGEGARWVVTHDADNVSPRRYRVKRIGPDDTVVSNAFPANVEPIGPIVAGSGAAWVPVDDGVLRFDATTGAYTDTVPLAGWNQIALVRIGSEVHAYEPGGWRIQRIGVGPDWRGTVFNPVAPVAGVAATPNGAWALASSAGHPVVAALDAGIGWVDLDRATRLPDGFTGTTLQAAGDTLWAVGALGGEPTMVRVDVHDDGRAVAQPPVTLRAPSGSEVLGLAGNDVLVAAQGRLYRVAIRS